MKFPISKAINQASLCFVFVATISLIGCEKTATTENIVVPPTPILPKDTPAIIHIPVSELQPCTLPEQYPIFYLNKSLAPGQNFELNIQVSKKGSWSLLTDTVNGIAFAGKGNFPDTGIYKVRLTGSGTPATVGTFNLRTKVGNQVRLITAAVIDSNVVVEPVPQNVYFKGKLGSDSVIVIGKPFLASDQTTTYDQVRYQSEISNLAIPTMGTVDLIRGVMYNHRNSTEADFKNFFKPGAYPLLLYPCQDTYRTNGVGLFYFDKVNNIPWLSVYDGQNQSGSSFTIVGLEDGYSRGNYFVKIKARVNCQMTNITTQERKLLTGEFVGYFVRQKP